jgi:hypothetical protein
VAASVRRGSDAGGGAGGLILGGRAGGPEIRSKSSDMVLLFREKPLGGTDFDVA